MSNSIPQKENIKSKAKTMAQIQEDYNRMPDGLSDAEYMRELERLWIPLEAVEKILKQLKLAAKEINITVHEYDESLDIISEEQIYRIIRKYTEVVS